MALFREHLAVGSLVALFGCGALFFTALLTDPILLGIFFLVVVVMSFAPDLDSDESTPYRIIFGTFTIAVTWLSIDYSLHLFPNDLQLLISIPCATFLFVWFFVGILFQAWTRHRGMFHSIPAIGIAALLIYLVARSYLEDDIHVLIFALGAGAGYFTHLLLDELYATETLSGRPFRFKRSLGTALKWRSASSFNSLFTYLLLVTLVYLAVQ